MLEDAEKSLAHVSRAATVWNLCSVGKALVETFRRNMEPAMTAEKCRFWSSHSGKTYAQKKCVNPFVHCVIFRDAVHEALR